MSENLIERLEEQVSKHRQWQSDAEHMVMECRAKNTSLCREIDVLRRENERLRQWVNDLQSGMYINCVYCGFRYGPDDEVAATMQESLHDHIAECPEHPLGQYRKALKTALRICRDALQEGGE